MSLRRLLTSKIERSLFGTMFAVVAFGLALVPLVFGLLLGVALAAPGQPASPPPAVSSGAPAPPTLTSAPTPTVQETHVEEIVRELQSIKTLGKWQIAVFAFSAVVIAILVLLLLLRYARIADKMKFGFGFLEFEVKDAVREATERAEEAEKSVKDSSRAINTIYTMVHMLQVLGASDEPAAFYAFLNHCAEETAAHMDARTSGTVRISVWLIDDSNLNPELRIAAGYRVSSATRKNFRLSDARSGFAWEVFKTAKTAIKNAKDEPDAITRDPDSRYGISWILGVPIWADESKKKPCGVLCVSHDQEEPLTKTDTTICSFYADLASTSVRLAQLRNVALG